MKSAPSIEINHQSESIMNYRLMYDFPNMSIETPLSVNPLKHTMHANSFLNYIGRSQDLSSEAYQSLEINCKKFSKNQKFLLSQSFKNGTAVKVIGAFSSDMKIVADNLGFTINEQSESTHIREKKIFNRIRPTFCSASKEGVDELWVFVFPSKQYVNQFATLIKAIFDNFEHTLKSNGKVNSKISPSVIEVRFKWIEENLSICTGFSDSIGNFVSDGEVVVFGNLEFMIPSIEATGFKRTNKSWARFGLNNMFGVATFANPISRRQMVLIGVEESFWGDASAQYVESAIKSGARHILYGSKAASLVGKKYIHNVHSPSSFLTMDDRGNITTHQNTNFHETLNTEALLKEFGVGLCGTAITVPNVITEDQKQRDLYEKRTPSIMDCENGHIASVVSDFNSKLLENYPHANKQNLVTFIPVHFITDYIHREDETTGSVNSKKKKKKIHDLSSHDDNSEYLKNRTKSFNKIGRLFAVYTLTHGTSNPENNQQFKLIKGELGSSIQHSIESVHDIINLGHGLDAIMALRNIYTNNTEIPINTAFAIAMIAQKFGYKNYFSNSVSELMKSENLNLLTHHQQAWLDMLILKYSCQIGDRNRAFDIISKFSDSESLELLRKNDQLGAYLRRSSLVYANMGKHELAYETIERSNENNFSHHHLYANKLYRLLIDLSLGTRKADTDVDEISVELSKIRNSLFNLDKNNQRWFDPSYNKCAIATLYLDAAFHLASPRRKKNIAGIKRLCLANSMNNRFAIGENSELFGEIVSTVKMPDQSAVIASSMRRDDTSKIGMQTFFSRHITDDNFNFNVNKVYSFKSEIREAHICRVLGISE